MNEKYLKLNRLYKEALPRICGSAHEYNRFLQTAAFNYRMSFNNSVAAFAQNVGTDLLLTYDQWQLYGRVPKRYSKRTLLFDNANRGRYTISYQHSTTVEDKRLNGNHREMKLFAYENNDSVVKAVQSIYQSDETSLQRILYSETMKRVNDFVTEDFLDVDNPTEFLSKSVVNMLLSRFGMEMPYTVLPQSISAEQLQKAFRTAMDVFRAEYAELAVQIPIELEKQQQEAQPIQNDYSRYTPMAQRYFTAKDNYPDALLVMRVGDFYEAFGDDARVIADQLEFVLTSRTIAEGERTPMCGFPAFKYNDYIDELVENGHTVGMLVMDENGEYQVELRTPDVTEGKNVEPSVDEPIESEKPVVVEPESPKIYQVITNAGDDGGYDEKQEYADVEEAIAAGKQYLMDGYTGFSVFNRDTQIIEHTEGEFDVESAYSADVLETNSLPVPAADDDRFVDGLNFDVDYFDRRFEDKSIPFLHDDESIKAILLSTQYLSVTKAEIATYFSAVRDEQKRIDYLKSIFNNAFSEVIIPDGRRMGYKPYKNVLQLWEGSVTSPTSQGYYDWGVIEKYYEGMRLLGELKNSAEAPKAQEGQLELIEGFSSEEKPSFVFSEEIIDAVLTRGSGVSQGKLRIYEQYQKPSTAKERISFLKNEYGWGGCAPAIIGTGINENHSGKGIELVRGFGDDVPRILLKWNQVEKRIGELIRLDSYLTSQEKEIYPNWLEQEEFRRTGVTANVEELPEPVSSEPVAPEFPVTVLSESANENDILWQNYSQAKADSHDRIVIINVGNYFEIMGTDAERIAAEFDVDYGKRILSNGESVSVFGYPAQQAQLFIEMIMDRGHDLAFVREETSEINRVLLNSGSKADPINSSLIAKVEYLDKNGNVDSTLDYTSEYRLKKDIQDETDIGYGMNVFLYKDKNGNVVDHDYLDNNKTILNLEILDYAPPQTEQTVLLEKFCEKEYDSDGADFSDLTAVNIAYTTTEDELHEIQADVNLVDYYIETKVDGKRVSIEQHDSLNDLVENGLVGIEFGDLVYVSDEQLAQFYESEAEPTDSEPVEEPPQDMADVPPEKPTITLTQQDIDRLLIQDPAIKEGKLRIYAAYREGLGEKSILRILQQEYRDSGGVIRSNDKSFLRNCNSQGIWVGDIGGDYQPTVITYQQIYQRIGELINENRYLNERELEEYNQIGSEDNAVIDFYDVRFAYKVGDTAFLYGKPYIISAVSDEEVVVYQEDSPLFVEKYPRQRFEEILNISAKDNKHLITKGTITFDIYQLADTDEASEILFQSLDKWKQRGISVNHADYEKVYSGELRHGETLEDIYETFNVHHPADFTGHSLSVSDVVVIHQYGRDRAFFCDSVGFPEIKGFFEEKVIEEPEQPKFIDEPAEDVVEVISSSDGIPAEEETVGAEELSQDIAEAENFVITDNNIGVGTPSQRYQNNVNAIKTLHELQAENRLPTPSEQKNLSQYVGWGGLSDNLRPGSTHSYELHDLLSQEEYRAACDSVLTAFYTPPVVVKSIYKALNNMGFTNGTILDPACGTGHFFGLLPDYLRGNVTLHGIEIDKISGEIAQMLYPNANIKVQGYEETKIPDNYLDVIVGNVPFGDYTVFDKPYNKHHLMIHDYFFVKSLDKVRPGGIIAFITSTGTMDKHNPIVRELLAEKADLLGAVRLPNNTFKAAAGTDVSSDIIFLQKRTSTELLRQYPDWCYTVKYDDEREINSYFAAHPEMICGKLDLRSSRFGGMDIVCVPNEGISLADELNRAIQNIQGTYVPYTAANETDEESEAESVVADEAARNYSFFVKDETIYYRENGLMTVVPYTGKKAERIKELVKLTDVTRELIETEAYGYDDEKIDSLRKRLNAVYDSFYRDYGSINSFANRIFKNDNSYPLLCSLENITTDEITEKPIVTKADIFFTRTIAPNIEITSADNAEEALIISMSQHGRVDLEYMAKLTGDSQEKLIAELNGDSIFLKPYEGEYVTADEYLSGNVREKLKAAQTAAQEDDKYKVNVAALEKVIPTDIPSSEISVRLGTTWIPVKYYNDFLEETFNPYSSNIEVQYNAMMGNYYVTGKTLDNYSVESVSKFGMKERNGYRILEDSLNLKTSEVREIKYIDGKEVSVVNREKTIIAQNKQEYLKHTFQEWVYKDPTRRRELERIYNDQFNCLVPRQYDGSHLTFPGMNPNIHLREHQVNAIARMLYGGNTLLAHQVGAGKTFEMIAGAMKLKELGLVHKSLICVPKHLTAQTGAEFMRLYPAANILVAEEKDFTPQNRKRFCTRIATGNYDAIIIGHTQLEKIPLMPQTQIGIFQQQLDEIINALEEAEREGSAGATVKSLARTKKSVENKLKQLEEKALIKDDVIHFEELGVDQLFIDEAHLFKNLFIYTKMTNVAGVGSGSESGRASDLYGKINYLDQFNPGRGVVFATGTPIANTMSEMFTMQRYLQPHTLKAMGLMNFDSWATTFGETVTALEIAPEGKGYRAKTRFAKFNNIPELMAMFKEVADVQTAETLKLPVPEVERDIVEIQPTVEQKEMIEVLGDRAEQIRMKKVEPDEDNILKIISDGKAIALDPRILDSENVGGGKVGTCAEKVFEIWAESSDQAQLIFSDLSTPTGKKNKGDNAFCAYDELKEQLIKRGIPEEQIKFIQNFKSSKAKQKLFMDVRKGKVRVLIGSTEMMGTGMNVQHKLVALHHLDCPNRPADIEQREGRIIRQGNTNPTVQIYNYVTKGTFDAFMYQMVERKQKFISSVMTAKHYSERSADDIDEATLNYGQIKAVASDNPMVMKKFEIDNKVNRLKSIRNAFINEHRRMEDEVQLILPKQIHKLSMTVDYYKGDMEFAEQNPEPNPFDIEIGGEHFDKRSNALEAIVQQKNRLKENELLPIGFYRGFHLYLYQEGVGNFKNLCLTVKHNLGYRVEIDPSTGIGNMARLNNVISHDIPQKHKEAVSDLAKLQKRMEAAKAEMNQPFPQESEYQALLQEQAEINAQLTVGDDKSPDNSAENESERSEENVAKGVISSSVGAPIPQAPVRKFAMRR